MISIVITAFTDYGDYATPLVEAIRAQEPGAEIIAVDNASAVPFRADHCAVIRFDEKRSWSHMLNAGARQAGGEWLMLLNDDVVCEGKFARIINKLNPKTLYGPEIRHKPKRWVGEKIDYLYAWLLLMHKDIYDAVGGFDESYIAAGVDDIEFCWTAQKLSYEIEAINLPFRHIADEPEFQHRRKKWGADYQANMEMNRKRFAEKVSNG